MGKVDRLNLIELNLYLTCFGLSAMYDYTVLDISWPCPPGPASLYRRTQSMSLEMKMLFPTYLVMLLIYSIQLLIGKMKHKGKVTKLKCSNSGRFGLSNFIWAADLQTYSYLILSKQLIFVCVHYSNFLCSVCYSRPLKDLYGANAGQPHWKMS